MDNNVQYTCTCTVHVARNVKEDATERERETRKEKVREEETKTERERERLLLNPSPEMRPHSPAYTARESPLLA